MGCDNLELAEICQQIPECMGCNSAYVEDHLQHPSRDHRVMGHMLLGWGPEGSWLSTCGGRRCGMLMFFRVINK